MRPGKPELVLVPSLVLTFCLCGEQRAGPEAEEAAETALVLTPYQKVQQGVSMTFWMGMLALATTCTFFIIRELFPRWDSSDVLR